MTTLLIRKMMYHFHNRSMICLSRWTELSFLFDINDRLLNATGLYEPPLPPMVRQRVILKETFHYLYTPSIGTLAAHNVFDCTFECLSNPLCSSLNLASSKRADGTLLCEFLSSDRYRNPKEYRRNQSSHHLLLRLFRGHSFLHSSLISIKDINNVIQLNISTHPFSVANLLLLQALEILYYLRSEYLLHQFWNHWRSLQSDWLSSVWFINETFTRRQKPIRFQG